MMTQTQNRESPSACEAKGLNTKTSVSIISNDTQKSNEIYQSFFNALYNGTEHDIELRALPSGKQLFTTSTNTAQIEKFIKEHIGENLYFGVCTREGQKGNKEAAREVPALWVDIDYKDFPGGEEEAKEFLKTFHIPPSIVVNTGNGLHLYWLFKEPEKARPQIEAYLKGLTKKMRGDIKAAELARILRIPGTFNQKNNQKKPVRLIELDTKLRYNLSDFEDFKDDALVENTAVHSVNVQEITDKCVFLKHCNDNKPTLPEPLWYQMVSNAARISPGGPDLVHAISQGHPGYSRSETDQKILHALNDAGPHTCQNIKETMKAYIGKDCGKNCHVKAPIALLNGNVNKVNADEFDTHNDPSPLRAVTIEELLQTEFPEREYLLHPILQTQSLNMVHAWRGLGKTYFLLAIAYSIAIGGSFLKWKAERPRAVLYIDGEMPGNALQSRMAAIVKGNEKEPPPGFFKVVTPDLQEPGNMPDLSTPQGQAAIDALVTPDTALIVVDNLSCLCRSGRENDAETWLPVQGWALRHRAAGRAIVFVHHSGKSGGQRGNSKKEDVLDLVLKLKSPVDYEPSQGACFEVIFEKCRHLTGSDTSSFEATLSTDTNGDQIWLYKDVVETTFERVVSLANEGLSQADIANELEINKSNVSRHLRKARDEGKLSTEVKK